MQTPATSTAASTPACNALRLNTFRLPLASCRFTSLKRGDMEGVSADGNYELSLMPTHGIEHCKNQYWAYETRHDEEGHTWNCTRAQFAVDDFGDLVEVQS